MGYNKFEELDAYYRSHAKPILWVKHWANNAADPCISQLISLLGFEGYGRFWRLVELASNDPTHEIPYNGKQGYKGFVLGLQFSDSEAFEGFISTLIDLDLAFISEEGKRFISIVETAARDYGLRMVDGAKGGNKASANRKRKQGNNENSY